MKHLLLSVVATMTIATGAKAAPVDPKPVCNKACKFKRARKRLRRHTSRHPIPDYIVECESGGVLHRQQIDGPAGGRYQIEPRTWRANLPKRRHVRLAGGNKGPRWSSRLLQDIVAANVRESQGLDAWSCA